GEGAGSVARWCSPWAADAIMRGFRGASPTTQDAPRMNAAPPPAPAPGPAPPAPPPVLTAWPRSAQLAAAFLLGAATVLLAVHATATSAAAAGPPGFSRARRRSTGST